MADRLTGRMARFVTEYIICMNGTEAARRAEYSGDDATLAVTASRLLRNDKVLRALDERLKEFTMPANEVLVHLSDIARGDLADTLNPAGAIDPLEAKRRGKSHLIKRFKSKVTTWTDKDGEDHSTDETEIEMYDRQAALNTLAKFHALLTDRLKVDDWRSQAIQDIRDGKIDYQALAEAFDDSLAAQLFAAAGVTISSGQSAKE